VTTSTACRPNRHTRRSTAVAGHRHGRRVRCIGLDVVNAVDADDAVFRHTAPKPVPALVGFQFKLWPGQASAGFEIVESGTTVLISYK